MTSLSRMTNGYYLRGAIRLRDKKQTLDTFKATITPLEVNVARWPYFLTIFLKPQQYSNEREALIHARAHVHV